MSRDVYERNRVDVDGFVYKPEYSNSTMAVYEKNGNIVFAFRGTWSIKDLFTDFKLAVGRLTSSRRFKQAEDDVRHTLRYFPKHTNIIFTGHSLGGSIATLMAIKYEELGYGFNIGVGIPEKVDRFRAEGVTLYAIEGDPISKLVKYLPYKVIMLPKASDNWYTNHKIDTIISLL